VIAAYPIRPSIAAARPSRRRAHLLIGAATVSLVSAWSGEASAQAQPQTVVLTEGQTVPNVQLGAGDDNLVVDIGRLDRAAATVTLGTHNGRPPVVSGQVSNAGGNDRIWLRAGVTQDVDIATGPVSAGGVTFTGGTVYEARGANTVLTLHNLSPSSKELTLAAKDGPLRLAGDGKIEFVFGVDSQAQPTATQQAIHVEKNLDSDERTLTLSIHDSYISGSNTDRAVIDVSNARRFDLTGGAGGTKVTVGTGTAIEGGDAEIHIDRGVQLQAFGSKSTASFLRSSGKVYNTSGSFDASLGGQNSRITGVELVGGHLYNTIEEGSSHTGAASGGTGTIKASGSGVLMAGGENYVENHGIIQSNYGAALKGGSGTSVVRNAIYKFSVGTASRAGEIKGATLAYEGGDGVDVIVNSGSITGDVQLAGGNDMFLFTEATNGVTGAIDGGAGMLDAYGRSYAATATAQLANTILNGTGLSGFELHGIEARGADTVVTVKAAAPLDAGVRAVGAGTVINEADIAADTGLVADAVANMDAGLRMVNRGAVSGSGAGSVGALVNATGVMDGAPLAAPQFRNEATIRANGGALSTGGGRAIAVGVATEIGGLGRSVTVTNTGTIEATGGGSAAVLASGVKGQAATSNYVLENTGTIRGGADTDFAIGAQIVDRQLHLGATDLGNSAVARTLAGAIQTTGTTDRIRNTGTIIGNTDLADGDDRFENYGTVQGDVRMGAGDDGYVYGVGNTLTGTVYGGAGNDTLWIDMTGAANKRLNGSQYKSFERIRRLDGTSGTGTLSVYGAFDVDSIQLGDIAVHVDAGDTVSSASDIVFTGGDSDDTLYVAGTVAGGVSLGAGNDVVVNSGVIDGDLDLGDGDDRYEALGSGLVTGTIDGGAGNDTLVFRLAGATGSIPGGFDGFESFAAYGPGTLQLALDRDYDTLELLEGANLTLTGSGGHSVDLIKGDDSAQTVKIDAPFTGGVSLEGGDDTLEMTLNGVLEGALDGGAGTDTLKLNLTGASTLNDLYGFELVSVTGSSPLTLQGTLGAGQQLDFDGSDNEFVIAAGATFAGKANGGAGNDLLRVQSGAAGSRTIVAGQLTGFENLRAEGAGTLELAGEAYSFQTVHVDGGLTVGPGATLASAGGIKFGTGDDRLTLAGDGAILSAADGGDGIDTLAFAVGAGQTRNLSSVSGVTGFEVLAASGAGTLNIDRDTSFDRVQLEGGSVSVAGGVKVGSDIVGGAGNDTVTNAGTIQGDVLLGDGDDRYVALAGGTVTGTIDGGAGNNTFVFRLDGGDGAIPGAVTNFNSFGAFGPGTLTVSLDAGQSYNNLELLEGANLVLEGSNGSVGNVIGDDSAQSVTVNGALTGGVSLGGGDDTLTLQLGGVLSGALDGGAGNDTLNLNLTADSTINGMAGFETANVHGASTLTLGGTLGAGQTINFDGSDNELIVAANAAFDGNVNGGAGRDLLRVQMGEIDARTIVEGQLVSFEDLVAEGAGSLALTGATYDFETVTVSGGALALGTGTRLASAGGVVFDGADNRLTLGSGATLVGHADGGAGTDTLALVQDAGNVRALSAVDASGFERLAVSGAGELRIDIDAAYDDVALDGGTTTIVAGKTLTAPVTGGASGDTLAVLGTLDGNVDLGGGDDRLVLGSLTAVTGTRSGGAGLDTLDFRTGGTDQAPTVFDGTGFDDFERLAVSGGTLSLTGDTTWDNVSVTGGKLIAAVGSTLTSDSAINVAAGATFGSGGIVNADINVAGTLAPGAAVGPMTVNGNVAFAAGSKLALDVAPTGSDLLRISGKLTVAQGASMDITGMLSATPGGALDLVVADGGITGGFSTINKSESVFGFVATRGNKIQIVGEFANSAAFGLNAQGAITYANAVLGASKKVQSFTGALPALVGTSGVSNEAAFARLSPEAYASAAEASVDNGLTITDTMRNLSLAGAGGTGLYGFGQGLAQWSKLAGDDARGAAGGNVDSTGLIGGIGYAAEDGTRLGAFVGALRTNQHLDALGASTRIEGMSAGVFLDTEQAGIGLHALVAYDASRAKTRRELPAGEAIHSRYDLGGWVIDASADHRFDLGNGVAVAPRIGATYVNGRRSGVTESGNDFALAVGGRAANTLFGDAAVRVEANAAGFRPYVEAGVRTRLAGDVAWASGSFADTASLGSMIATGVDRNDAVGRISAGFGADVGQGMRINLGYTGEYGGTTRHNVSGGLSIRF